MSLSMDRRKWMKKCSAWLASTGLLAGSSVSCKGTENGSSAGSGYNAYFGDIHNHNSLGYAKGSLERSFDIAASHLDFFSMTPHSHWHDMPVMEKNKHMIWVNGFKKTREGWPKARKLTESYYKPGRFVTFHGYEWHSSRYGDFCMIFPGNDAPMTAFDSPEQLQEFAFGKGALLIPHHPAYLQGRRGANPSVWDPRVTGLLEIFSEHGNAEIDRGPCDYIRHSMGGRSTPNTLQAVLAAGHRVGVLASTDDHLGYPGAYGEGLAAVLAPELTREAVFEALRNRRTYGVTGDRIRLGFTLNGHVMGQEIPFVRERNLAVQATGWDSIERVEVLRNNEVIHRDFPMDRKTAASPWRKPVLVRIELGWGPWASLEIPRVCDWEADIELRGGQILEYQPCFQSGPLDEKRRNRVSSVSDAGLQITSYTSRKQAFAESPTNAVVLRIQGNAETSIEVKLSKPSLQSVKKNFSELARSNQVTFTGPFPDESLIVHRPVMEANASTSFSFTNEGTGNSADWYYVRVVQANGQMAWSSPIWVEKRA